VCVLLAAAVIGPVSMGFAPRGVNEVQEPSLRYRGTEAALRGWVTRTPHPRWPPPTDWQYFAGVGREHYGVRADPAIEGSKGREMDLWRWGWPRPVFESVSFSWDESDPALPAPSDDPPERVVWENVALNAGLLGVPLSLAGAAAWGVVGRRGRARVRAGVARAKPAFVLALLVLLVAAVNPYVAEQFVFGRDWPWWRSVSISADAVGGSLKWPSPTPHSQPWPRPDRWDRTWRSGLVHEAALAKSPDPGRPRFQMESWRWGWPLPVYERLCMWWDEDNPELRGPDRFPAPRVLWRGMLLNPVILGVPPGLLIWVLMCVPAIGRAGRKRRWRRGGRCVFCGYPVGIGPVCTECGREGGGGKLMQPGAGLGHIAQ
jgi:hypothetical protein